MRAVRLIPVVSALTLVVALSGCGRLGAHTVTPAAPPSPAISSTPVAGASTSGDSLGDIESDLSAVDGATSQSNSDLTEGDQAAQQNDSQ